ncbi:hypothetical protein BH10ACT7_BH10ACT7_17000 [soil metagenome]
MLESLPAAIQIVIAAVAAYSIAHFAFGHPAPIIAVTVTITTLGINRDARPRKVLATSLGLTVGIAVSELIVIGIGRGAWQLAIVLLATLLVTRALSSNPAFAIAAAAQSSLVVLLPDPEGGAFTRSVDGLIAGVIALAVTALIPRDPRRAAARDARTLFSVFKESLDGVVEALHKGDHQAAELALERLRRTQVLVDNWTSSLDTATAIARISPWIHRQLPELAMQARVLKAADLTARHLRTVTRRVSVVAADGKPRPELANLMAELANGVALLGQQVDDRELTGASRSVFEDLARRLDPETIMPDAELRESLIIVLLRPLVVDLLAASGMPPEEAKLLLPPI